MRTVKFINNEAEEALIKYNEHCNNCPVCQHSPTCAEDEITCHEAEWLYEDYERLRSEADYADQIFKAELKERNLVG